MTLQTRRLSFALGAEVRGIDLSRPLDGPALEAVRRAWAEHLVLVFPEQELTGAQFACFSEHFGELEVLGSYQGLDEYQHPDSPGVLIVTNRAIRGEPSRTRAIGRKWHADRSFAARAPVATLLYCREIPEVGGNTMFANQHMAYETLSAGLRKALDGLWAVHDVMGRQDSVAKSLSPEQLKLKRAMDPPTEQPVVRAHETTGRKALYVSEAVTTRLVGMTREESAPLLEYLFTHCVRPEFTHRHSWRPGDVVVWDNRCAMHLALADFDPKEPRTMWRASTLADVTGRPVEARSAEPALSA